MKFERKYWDLEADDAPQIVVKTNGNDADKTKAPNNNTTAN